jgi:drug/metabolite transporter (DMT)-like permease
MSSYLTGALLVIISAVAFGAMPIFARFAYAAGADVPTLLFLRFSTSGLLLLGWTLFKQQPLPVGRVLWICIGMGALGYFGQALSYFTALTLVPAGLLALLLYLYPALVAGMAALFLKERLTRLRLFSLLLALSGTALVIAPTGVFSGNGQVQPLGIVLGLMAAGIYSGYILVGSRIIRSTGAEAMSMVIMLAAAVSFAALLGVRGLATGEGLHLPQGAAGWAALAGLTLISTVLAMVAFLAGIKRIGPTTTSLLSTLEPMASIILAMLLLGESLVPLQAGGGALILSAVLTLTLGEGRSERQKVEGPAGIEAPADPSG